MMPQDANQSAATVPAAAVADCQSQPGVYHLQLAACHQDLPTQQDCHNVIKGKTPPEHRNTRLEVDAPVMSCMYSIHCQALI